MEVDYIIVGIGLAGISFCEQLKIHKKSFVVFDNASQQSSTVAGGLYNPVVLKRFTSVWNSEAQLDLALPLYENIEKELKVTLDYKIPVYRKFASLEEQNDWFTASDKPRLAAYLSPKLIKNNNPAIDAPFNFGEVLTTGRIDVKTLIESYKSHLLHSDSLLETTFDYEALIDDSNIVTYKNIKAKHIVFAEGFGVTNNPFFNYLPMVPTKGELLTIEAPGLNMDFVLKAGVFLIPQGNDLYTVGATYDWHNTTHDITDKAKTELLGKLEKVIHCDFKVVKQVAGIRPTVKDRRPLVGKHNQHQNMYVLNGLGTRGVMIGPYVAKALFEYIEFDTALELDINIERFK